MTPSLLTLPRHSRLLVLPLVVLAIVPTAWAWQPAVRGGVTRGTREPGPAQTTVTPGSYHCVVQAFEAVQNGSQEDQIGVLKLKPSEKGAKLLVVRVLKKPGVAFRFGPKDMDLETMGEVLQKGMYCLVEWEWEATEGNKKPKNKDLKVIQVDGIEVEGKVESVEDGFVNLKVRPVNGDWPDAVQKASPRGRSEEIAPVKEKKLHVKLHDALTKYSNNEGKPGDLGDFEPGAKIEATVVYARKEGILLHMQPPGTKMSQIGRQPAGPTRPQPPPPPGRKAPGGG